MLGETGAIVYCTGRSSRVQAHVSSHVNAGRPETIEETADMVTADAARFAQVDWTLASKPEMPS